MGKGSQKGSFTLEEATKVATLITDRLKLWVSKVEVCGSIRRRVPTVGDIDIIVSNPKVGFKEWLSNHYSLTLTGPSKYRFTYDGIQVDIDIYPEETWGASLMHATGSRMNNIILRSVAKKKGFQLSQYGLFKDGTLIAGKTEEEIYEALGLPFKQPEERSK